MSRPIRSFIAIPVPETIVQQAVSLIDRWRDLPARVKWVDAQQMHLTLNFLGEVEPTLIPAVCQEVIAAAEARPAFPIVVRGVGAFPDVTRPRTIWLGIDTGQAAIVELKEELDARLEPHGFRPESRRFTPHLTLGRVRNSRPADITQLGEHLSTAADFVAGDAVVDCIEVLGSRLRREGPEYRRLGHGMLA